LEIILHPEYKMIAKPLPAWKPRDIMRPDSLFFSVKGIIT